ncbi:exoribonuclease [Xylona heveae TC161]|uniref:Exoribonuclease n=1 Tax=Xylona heveae (strain CBS 132557 / TC161) TaxID=1328760 RepID=A0A165HBW0_XYLHT|nr:exoribonuclease [Xylona heveae TC161]KZF23273.1 exoribonuclease [Xylona heveae TC161]
MAADRRRINGPPGGTAPPYFASSVPGIGDTPIERPVRTRQSNQLRKIFLKTGLAPSASGSAYIELEPSSQNHSHSKTLVTPSSSLKLTCTVHGPRPLPRSAPFTPHILLSTHVKFAPFAARQRRGYIRDASERDLGVHLETALRGVIIGDRWPKSGVEVVVTILEGEEDRWWGDEATGGSTGIGGVGGWGMMNVLAGCITVASAAIADAGIDCVDLVSGGVAALVGSTAPSEKADDAADKRQEKMVVLDPCPSEHKNIIAACVVGYLFARDEITELWLKGDMPGTANTKEGGSGGILEQQNLIDHAVEAAAAARLVLGDAVKEAAELKLRKNASSKQNTSTQDRSTSVDVEMGG